MLTMPIVDAIVNPKCQRDGPWLSPGQPSPLSAERQVAETGTRGEPRLHGVRGDHPAIVVGAVLQNAPLRRVVHIHDPEAPAVAPRPLKVIEERPDEVAFERRPLADRRVAGREVALEVAPPRLAVD